MLEIWSAKVQISKTMWHIMKICHGIPRACIAVVPVCVIARPPIMEAYIR